MSVSPERRKSKKSTREYLHVWQTLKRTRYSSIPLGVISENSNVQKTKGHWFCRLDVERALECRIPANVTRCYLWVWANSSIRQPVLNSSRSSFWILREGVSHSGERIRLGEGRRFVAKLVLFEVLGAQFLDCSDTFIPIVDETVKALFEFAPAFLLRHPSECLRGGLGGFSDTLAGENKVVPPDGGEFLLARSWVFVRGLKNWHTFCLLLCLRLTAHRDAYFRRELAYAFVGELPQASSWFNQTSLADNRNVLSACS
jgi:hypothetical protein